MCAVRRGLVQRLRLLTPGGKRLQVCPCFGAPLLAGAQMRGGAVQWRLRLGALRPHFRRWGACLLWSRAVRCPPECCWQRRWLGCWYSHGLGAWALGTTSL